MKIEQINFNLELMSLRQKFLSAAGELISKQSAYAEAVRHRKSRSHLRQAVLECLSAAAPYQASLEELLRALRRTESSELRDDEIGQVEDLLKALGREKESLEELNRHYSAAGSSEVRCMNA